MQLVLARVKLLVLEGNGLAHILWTRLVTVFNIGVTCLGLVPWLSARAMYTLNHHHIKLGELSGPVERSRLGLE